MPVKTISREYRGYSEEDVNAAGAEDIELMEAAGWRISSWKLSHEPPGRLDDFLRSYVPGFGPAATWWLGQPEDYVLRVTLTRQL